MSGIVGSYFNIRGSGVVAKLGTDGQLFTSTGAGLKQGFEDAPGGGITVAQQFRLAAEQAGSASTGTVLENWEENDTDYQALGSAFSQSSGVFSCDTTGIYLCHWDMIIYGASSGDAYDPNIQISVNSGTNYYIRSRTWNHVDSGQTKMSSGQTFIFDVANTSTFRLYFAQSETNSIHSGTNIMGATDQTWTHITFVRLGDT